MPLSALSPVLDDRRYDQLVEEVRARIPRYTREWTDFNDSDPGMVLVQLFAALTDMQLFRLGSVPLLNQIKLYQLLGFELLPAEPARAEIAFPAAAGATTSVILVPERTQVSAEVPGVARPLIFETERGLVALTHSLDKVLGQEGSEFPDFSELNRLAGPGSGFHPFGPRASVDNALLLGFDPLTPVLPFPEVALDLYFVLADEAAPAAVSCDRPPPAPPADIVWEGFAAGINAWVPLTLVRDDTVRFTRSGHVFLRTLPSGTLGASTLSITGMLSRYWIRARLLKSSYERPPRIRAVRINTVPAIQAQTIREEVPGGGNGRPDLELITEFSPVVAGSLRLEVDDGDGSEFVRWKEVDDFFGARRDDRVFLLNRTTGVIRFGDGVNGAIPALNPRLRGSNVVAREYRVGGGKPGNVAAGLIRTLMSPVPGIDDGKVANLLAAVGGRDEEDPEAALRRMRHAVRSRTRAVTAEDFEQLAIEAGSVRRAKALARAHPRFPGVEVPGAVTVIVVPDSDDPRPTPSEAALRNVCGYLNQVRLLTTELFVVPPRYHRVDVSARVLVEPTADLGAVRDLIATRLTEYFHPLRGGEDGLGWPFGGAIYYSRVYQRASVPGVDHLEEMIIAVDGQPADPCTNITICDGALLYSGSHDIRVEYAGESL